MKECIELLGHKVKFSDEINISLVMGHLPPMMAKTGLGIEEANALKDKWKKLKCYLWKNEAGRFHHLKLYRFKTDKCIVSVVGSCNFTLPGLFWNLEKKNDEKVFGNVESMMLDWHEGIEWSTQEAKNSDFDKDSTADDAPTPLPFYVAVFYDWKSREYSWSLMGNLDTQKVLLKLADIEISIDKDSIKGSKSGSLTSSLYTVKSDQWDDLVGCVIELNLDESTREYSKPLVTDVILQSWLQGAVNEPVPEFEDEDEENSQKKIKNKRPVASDDEDAVFFEFFDFYRATAGFETKLLSCQGDDELGDLLVFRSDSVWALGSVIDISKQSATVKYLVLNECIRLMKLRTGTKKKLQASFIKQLQGKVNKYREAVKEELKKDNDMPFDSEELLKWYEHQFRRAAE